MAKRLGRNYIGCEKNEQFCQMARERIAKEQVENKENIEDVVEVLPQNTPTLIKIIAMLGTFNKNKVLEITRKFGLKNPNWL